MCDGIVAEAQESLKSKLRSSPGRVTLAVGRAQTIRGEAIYTACHFIDDQWKLHRVLLDAYVVAPAIGYHDPLIGSMRSLLKCCPSASWPTVWSSVLLQRIT